MYFFPDDTFCISKTYDDGMQYYKKIWWQQNKIGYKEGYKNLFLSNNDTELE